MEFLFEQFITGLSIGSILLIVALGLSIIYGSMGVINMAHGEFIMLGAYGAWALKAYAGISLFPSLSVSMRRASEDNRRKSIPASATCFRSDSGSPILTQA